VRNYHGPLLLFPGLRLYFAHGRVQRRLHDRLRVRGIVLFPLLVVGPAAIAQRIEEQAEGRGQLAAGRIVDMVAHPGGPPSRQHRHQAPFRDIYMSGTWSSGTSDSPTPSRAALMRSVSGETISGPPTRTRRSSPSHSSSQAGNVVAGGHAGPDAAMLGQVLRLCGAGSAAR
jgi:hypothetical protein